VAAIYGRRSGAKTELLGPGADHTESERMERSDINLGCGAAKNCLQLSTQCGRGSSGESDGQDTGGWHRAIDDEVCDPAGERRRLAAARTCQDAERSIARGNRRALLR